MLKIFKLTGTTVYLTIWPDCWLKTFFERGGGGGMSILISFLNLKLST